MLNRPICIAGKNSIALAGLSYVLENYGNDSDIFALGDKQDTYVDKWQPSYLKFAKSKGIKIVELEDLYAIDDLCFISLEYFKLIDPYKFSTESFFNIHFSLLPAYRGMYTSAHPILNSESKTGCTIHEIDDGIDTGKIISQSSFNIDERFNCKDVYENYLKSGIGLVFDTIDSLIQDSFQSFSHPQDGGSYYPKSSIDYENLDLDFSEGSENLIRQIRAYSFRDYQLPVINKKRIFGYTETEKESKERPGTIKDIGESKMVISTSDRDVVVFCDNFDQLDHAVNRGDEKSIPEIINLNPKTVNEKNKYGWTPLIISSYLGKHNILRTLLDNGADVNVTNPKGTTPLMYAKYFAERTGDLTGLEILLEAGSKKDTQDIFRKNIFDYLDEKSPYNKIITNCLS